MQNLAIVPAFEEPVTQAQQTFRRLLKAMSEPGEMVRIPPLAPLGSLCPATHAVCLTLLDSQTPLWLSDGFADSQIRRNLHFHTGMPLTTDPAAAHFALARGDEIDALERFSRGSAEYPEQGCTLVIQLESLAGGRDSGSAATTLQLSGPGIENSRRLNLTGLGQPLVDYLVQRPDSFPWGLDFIFTEGRSLVAIPRTTQVEVC